MCTHTHTRTFILYVHMGKRTIEQKNEIISSHLNILILRGLAWHWLIFLTKSHQQHSYIFDNNHSYNIILMKCNDRKLNTVDIRITKCEKEKC